MPSRARLTAAAALLAAAWFASRAVSDLAGLSRNQGVRISFDMLGIELGLLMIAFAAALALPGRVGDRLGLGPGRLPWSALVALVVGTLGLNTAIDGALSLTRATEGSIAVGISRALSHTPWSAIAFAAFGTALAPGLAEEILCRGLVQRSVARYAGSALAVLVGAVFFGWLHGEWVHGSIALAMGLYLGTAAAWADSTRIAIAAHTINNAAALLGSVGLLRSPLAPRAAIAVGGALAVVGLAWAWRCRPRGAKGVGPLQLPSETADL